MSAPVPLLRLEGLTKTFALRRTVGERVGRTQVEPACAVDDVSFTLHHGEILGLAGESGSGKTTLARCIIRLVEPDAGTIELDGIDVRAASGRRLRELRRRMQMVFQDPYSSLNPRKSVGQIVGEPYAIHRTEKDVKRRVQDLLARVGLNPEHYNRYPHEFSGGQRQRIGVARAIALQPKLVVCDEPVSALDVSVQAQILNLLKDLQHDFDLTYVFISHDLSVIRQISDRIAVMYLGRVVELSTSEGLYEHPRHPYTAALLSAVPRHSATSGKMERHRIVLGGDVPSPVNPPEACVFHPRCPRFQAGTCDVETPLLRRFEGTHEAACHFPVEHWPMTEEELRRPSLGSAA